MQFFGSFYLKRNILILLLFKAWLFQIHKFQKCNLYYDKSFKNLKYFHEVVKRRYSICIHFKKKFFSNNNICFG